MAALLFLIVVLIFRSFFLFQYGDGRDRRDCGVQLYREDQDINNAELVYTEWETDLQMRLIMPKQTTPAMMNTATMWAISGTTL